MHVGFSFKPKALIAVLAAIAAAVLALYSAYASEVDPDTVDHPVSDSTEIKTADEIMAENQQLYEETAAILSVLNGDSEIVSDSISSESVAVSDLDEEGERDGFPAVLISVFGDYSPRTYTVTTYLSDGTSVTSSEVVPGLAGLDWYWLSGVCLFAIVLISFFKVVGVVFKRG